MNEPRPTFRQFAEAARSEPVPAIDVTARVLHRLNDVQPSRGGDAPLWLATVLSLAAAALVMTLVGYQEAWSVDPLADLFQPFVAVMR
jgi:hypothetical protein